MLNLEFIPLCVDPVGRYFGGKAKKKVRSRLVSLFCSHKKYVETHGGLWSVGLWKWRSLQEVYNEINPSTFALMLEIRDNPAPLIKKLNETIWSRELYQECKAILLEHPDPYATMVQCCLSHIGGGIDPRSSVGVSQSRIDRYAPSETEYAYSVMVDCVAGFLGGGVKGDRGTSAARIKEISGRKFDYLYRVSDRLSGVEFSRKDALEVIQENDDPDTLIYIDPPYLKSTRVSGEYAFDYTEQQHKELLNAVVSSRAKIVLSNYDNDLYNDALKGWRKTNFITKSSGWSDRREEVWLNWE